MGVALACLGIHTDAGYGIAQRPRWIRSGGLTVCEHCCRSTLTLDTSPDGGRPWPQRFTLTLDTNIQRQRHPWFFHMILYWRIDP